MDCFKLSLTADKYKETSRYFLSKYSSISAHHKCNKDEWNFVCAAQNVENDLTDGNCNALTVPVILDSTKYTLSTAFRKTIS